MPKYKTDPFIQLNRFIFHKNCNLSHKAKWLYTVLSELEHRYTGDKTDYFFRSQEDLAKDTGFSIGTNRKLRKELVENKWISTWNMHWIDKETKKLSEKHVKAYKLLQ